MVSDICHHRLIFHTRTLLSIFRIQVGPMAIVGGTATIYTAALSHSSSTLTPVSVLYLLLLALNYSIMPRISKKYIPPKVNKKSVALVEGEFSCS